MKYNRNKIKTDKQLWVLKNKEILNLMGDFHIWLFGESFSSICFLFSKKYKKIYNQFYYVLFCFIGFGKQCLFLNYLTCVQYLIYALVHNSTKQINLS